MTANRSPERTVRLRASWPAGTLAEMLSEDSRSVLLRLGIRRVFSNGDILIREQDKSSDVILLCQAVVKVTGSLENGRAALLGIKVSGDVVGEMAALSGSPRCATVTACGRAIVRVIPKREFLDYLKEYPDAHFALTRMIMYRLREGNQRRVDFAGYPAIIRLARALEELASSYGRMVDDGLILKVGLTQRDLGALVGVEEDTTRKELGKLKDRGVIRTGYRSITILDRSMLDKIASEHD
jgi:CRP/FNR family transcriptional regulator, cyclic AMP receptor protein